MTPGPGIKPGPQRWKESALTTAPSPHVFTNILTNGFYRTRIKTNLFLFVRKILCSCKPTLRLLPPMQAPRLSGTAHRQGIGLQSTYRSVNKRYHTRDARSIDQYICGYHLLYPYLWSYWPYFPAGVWYRWIFYSPAYRSLMQMQLPALWL